MAPPDKVSAEQKTFLFSLMNAYLEAQKIGRLDKFWLEMQGAWFHKWAEEEDTTITDKEERATAHAEAIAARIKYLRRWYPNHSGKKNRANPYGRLIAQAVKKARPTRRPQLVQLYTKLYYAQRIAPLVQAEMRRLTILKGKKPSRGVFLRLLRIYSTARWKLEKDNIKDKVIAEYDRRQKEKDEAAEPGTPSAYAAAIEDISIHFDAFSDLLSSMTGWSFTLLAGGPDPNNRGQIRTFSVHSGKNHAGMHFGKAMPNFLQQIVSPYAVFLRSVYTPSECAARSLLPIQINPEENRSGPPDLSLHVDVPVSESIPAVLQDAATNPLVQVAASTLPTGVATPDVSCGAATPIMVSLPHPTSDFDYDFSFEELNLLGPGDLSFEQLDGALEKISPPGGYLSLVDELAAPLPEDILRQLTELVGPDCHPTHTASDTPIADANALSNILAHDHLAADAQLPTGPQEPPVASLPMPPMSPPPTPPTTDGPIAPSEPQELTPPESRAPVTPPVADGPADAASSGSGSQATPPTPQVLSKSASGNGTRKRTRDNIDTAFIIHGKRARKTKSRDEVEAIAPSRGKQNRAPQ
ncbi:hypothetical protein PLEOSDRAFT_165491 [Pleurotus ostreatus PC15]|uniref:Uncharacterized protein n=1 Tax=Pleurotus ostreatus (strain PC15) TaxID=1137138 RepID=A0A067NZ15_PLEO1|nr:hypothetical protein PLEOSDRAFT_165491 [Pleurotus ostreatus PC15]